MKAEELMINDLVIATEYIYNENTDDEKYIEHYARVTDISPAAHLWIDNYECSVMIDWLDDCDAEMFYGDLKPIPLTKEILRANGFILRGKTDINQHDVYFYNYICKNNNYCHSVSYDFIVNTLQIDYKNYVLSIMYVHQLQHALRLCGLNELADNFKIE